MNPRLQDAITQKQSRDKIQAASNKMLAGHVIELCKVHLHLYPNDVYVWLVSARTLIRLSRYEEVEAAFYQVLEPGDERWHSMVHNSRGELNQRRGDYLEAKARFLKAIETAPNNVAAYVLLGVVTFRRGDLKLAKQRLRAALDCDCAERDKDEAYFNLGGVLLAQERYEEAGLCYERAIELDPLYKTAKQNLRDVRKITGSRTA